MLGGYFMVASNSYDPPLINIQALAAAALESLRDVLLNTDDSTFFGCLTFLRLWSGNNKTRFTFLVAISTNSSTEDACKLWIVCLRWFFTRMIVRTDPAISF
mmetsp:Transcript_18639/g.40580  ORF Transcript_18639/g.40580 Transcript_18639/m.40580 type:complete len:102 (+) Transcript_18639:357-662(+)